MLRKDTVYITGHMHPDTDSIASAIAYSFFKRAMGIPAVPCRLGQLNKETEYLLERFGFEPPMLLTDARVRMSELDLDPPHSISPETTIAETLKIMDQEKHTYCGVVDEEGRLVGLVTKGDIALVGLGDTAYNIDILSKASVENIRKSIDGTTVYAPDERSLHLNGRVSIIAMTDTSKLRNYDLEDRVVILGDNAEAQMLAITRGAGLLIPVWTKEISPEVLECARKHSCPIILSGHGATNTARYIYFAPSVSQIMNTKVVTFNDNELSEDVGLKMQRSRYHVYLILNAEGKLVGYGSRYHIMNSENKKLILVDHNEFSQSVRAIEKARILEVLDHHRINDFSSTQPVAFRNEIVGSTATIVATIFRENQIPLQPNLAGLLLGALLSDTMAFHSPTTTDKDRQTANILAAMAGLDIDEFAKEMFTVSASTEGRSLYEMINQDVKFYDIRGCKLAISQIITGSVKQLRTDSVSVQPAIDRFVTRKRVDLAVVVFTSIVENGSVVFCGGDRAGWGQEAFPDRENEEHSFQEGLMSRKQQILPRITEIIEHYI